MENKKNELVREISKYGLNQKPISKMVIEIEGIKVGWHVFEWQVLQNLCAYFPSNQILLKEIDVDLEITWASPELSGLADKPWRGDLDECCFLQGFDGDVVSHREFLLLKDKHKALLIADYELGSGLGNGIKFFLKWMPALVDESLRFKETETSLGGMVDAV